MKTPVPRVRPGDMMLYQGLVRRVQSNTVVESYGSPEDPPEEVWHEIVLEGWPLPGSFLANNSVTVRVLATDEACVLDFLAHTTTIR